MSEQNNLDVPVTEYTEVASRKPDDSSGLLIEAKFKITCPDTGEVIVEGRS